MTPKEPFFDQKSGTSGVPAVLSELGERRIIDEYIKPAFSATGSVIHGIGDDTATLRPRAGWDIVVTTDPCPTPVVSLLGDNDLWHWGRLTQTICLSDLAAAGAEPLGIVVSTVMPPSMSIAEYARYLESLEYYAQLWKCPVVGGNIRDGSEFSTCATAIGQVPQNSSFSRSGAKPGDAICVVGRVGHFWAAVLASMHNATDLLAAYSHEFGSALTEPTPKIEEATVLRSGGRISSCVDASDGLGAAVELLARANALDMILSADQLRVDACVEAVAESTGIHPLALGLSWGDWQLIFTADPDSARLVQQELVASGSECRIIGTVSEETSGRLLLKEDTQSARAIRSFGSERFQSSSYFTHGLEGYVDLLRSDLYLS